jgi:predicted phage terminase large subunit-like protein
MELSLYEFLGNAWPLIEPGVEYVDNWHIEYVAEWLEMVTDGRIRRLAICEPPRHMKSILGTIAWPCWEWTSRPELQYIITSYADMLSSYHSRKRRDILRSDWYRSYWPDTRISPLMDQNNFFESTAGGHMIASSIMGTATGLGGNRVIIDDPMNPRMAESEAERDRTNQTVSNTLFSRLNDKNRDAMVLYMQRLNRDDTFAHLTGVDDDMIPTDTPVFEKNGWTIVRLPAVCEQDMVIEFPKSEKTVFRAKGDALWEGREGLAVLNSIRSEHGEEYFTAQYQQRAMMPGGNIIKLAWLNNRYYQPPHTLPVEAIITSWDAALKDKESSSYVVGQVWGRYRLENYLLDQVRGRWDFPTTLNQIRSVLADWPGATATLIEDAANGPAIISTLRSEVAGIVPVTPEGSKIARLKAVSPLFANGHVWYPDAATADWMPDYVREISTFSGIESKNKRSDQVDATSQALSYLERTYGLRSLQDPTRRPKYFFASKL